MGIFHTDNDGNCLYVNQRWCEIAGLTIEAAMGKGWYRALYPLIQAEKMSSLGQLVAGVAHEINNPVNFIYGNLIHAQEYTETLLNFINLYQNYYPNPPTEIIDFAEDSDLDFLIEDMPNILNSMKMGANRIREIILSLRNFSRLDEAEMKAVDIHEGIDNTLLILHNRLKENSQHQAIQLIKNYDNIPLVECYAGQLNQVFMNLISNAIDALGDYSHHSSIQQQQNHGQITVQTELLDQQWVRIKIADNGMGMSEKVKSNLFNPFFTTKPVGKGTGLGLSISYQIIVEKHKGSIQCNSQVGHGTEFIIEIPLHQH